MVLFWARPEHVDLLWSNLPDQQTEAWRTAGRLNEIPDWQLSTSYDVDDDVIRYALRHGERCGPGIAFDELLFSWRDSLRLAGDSELARTVAEERWGDRLSGDPDPALVSHWQASGGRLPQPS